jgi:hypothetical protein
LVFAAVRQGNAAKLPSAGLRLNASKSESMPERDDYLQTICVPIGFGPEPYQANIEAVLKWLFLVCVL